MFNGNTRFVFILLMYLEKRRVKYKYIIHNKVD